MMIESKNFSKHTVTLWFCHLLIGFYPVPFRERFEFELNQVVNTHMRYGRKPGHKNLLLQLWTVWIPDLFFSLIDENFKSLEEMMKTKVSVSKIFGLVLLVLWFVFLGLTYARVFLHLNYQDPTEWLLGKNPSSLAFTALNVFLLLTPFIALILAVKPFFSINRSSNSGEFAEIRILKAKGLSLVLIVACSIVSLLLFSLIIGVKFFNL